MTNAIDLSQLSPPDLLLQTDFETLLQEQLDQLAVIDPDYAADLTVGDPGYNVMLAVAYVRQIDRQRFNEAGRGVMLAYANNADLDHMGATLANLKRELITPEDLEADPPVSAVYESDAIYRLKIQLANEGLTTAGSRGGYRYHALTAGRDITRTTVSSNENGDVVITKSTMATGLDEPIKEIAVLTPVPGVVEVVVMNYVGNGVPTAELLTVVETALSDEDKIPLTDTVRVTAVEPVNYTIEATLHYLPGVDSALVEAEALAAAQAYADEMHSLGRTISTAGIMGALYQAGVDKLRLTAPAIDLEFSEYKCGYCTSINLYDGAVI